jgi:DNA transformation protein
VAVREEYLEYVLEQLEPVGHVVSRRMFGGVGLYMHEIFFAIVADDVLYFKVDEISRNDYEQLGMSPFRPYKNRDVSMRYYEVPIEVLEDTELLDVWVHRSLEAADGRRAVH